jgi:hypothetical protein
MADEVVPAAAGRRGYGLPLALCGLLIAGAVPLGAWINALSGLRVVHGGVWIGYSPLMPDAYFPPPASWFVIGGRPYGQSFYYLGWYWALALTAGHFLAVAWYRQHARRRGTGFSVRYLVAAAALFVLAIALPVLTQAMPVLSRLWLWQPWVKGIPALLIVGGVLGVLARAERSRSLALLAALYAAAALLASVFLTLTQEGLGLWWPASAGWRAIFTPLTVLLLPAAVLIIAGLATSATRRTATSA